jgi:hypothetical protein
MTALTPVTTATTDSDQIPVDEFRGALLAALDEAFVGAPNPWTLFTDKGSSLLETLATIDAATASKVISSRTATIAAQVNHTRFYLDVLLVGLQNGFDEKADWAGSWQIGEVNDEEWQDLIARLRDSFVKARAFVETNTEWNPTILGGAFGLVAHSAYHLGEIRQALAALQVPE